MKTSYCYPVTLSHVTPLRKKLHSSNNLQKCLPSLAGGRQLHSYQPSCQNCFHPVIMFHTVTAKILVIAPDSRRQSLGNAFLRCNLSELRFCILFLMGAIPLCCSTNLNILQSKYNNIFSNVKLLTASVV